MLSSKVEVKFSVKASVKYGETVCVVGDCPELGNWQPEHAKPLAMERKVDKEVVWSTVVQLPRVKDVNYRYFIGHYPEADHEGGEKNVMVREWETNLRPRRLSFTDPSSNAETDPHIFGYYDGKESIDKGWLTGQTEVHLRLYGNPLNFWKARHRSQTYRVRCTPIDLRYKDLSMDTDDEESNHELPTASAANKILVSTLNGVGDLPSEQAQFGTVYRENDFITFRAQTFEPEYLAYQFDYYVHKECSGETDIPKHVATSYILPVNLQDTSGIKTIPINGLQNKPIGQLKVDYLIIKPIRSYSCTMEQSFARHWKRQRRPLDVGHRGMGSSYAKKFAAVTENTLASLAEAGGHGADFVEFDVQLSKDKVPVIYHDFLVCLSLKRKSDSEMEYFEIPVTDLNLSQLQELKVDHVSEKVKGGSPMAIPREESDPEEQHPFPTLRRVFEHLDPHIGFNVEVKYCMKEKSGQMEDNLKYFMERNEYLDIIVDDVLRYGGDRRIVFSCFDPDVCTMLRLKQNRYPVFFLCYGPTEAYSPFLDMRTWNIPASINFAHSEQLLGLNPHSEDLLRDRTLISQAKERGLVVFCWGEDNNSKDNIRKLKEDGVDGVIYDRIYELKETKQNVFKMENEAKVAMLKSMGFIGNSNPDITSKMHHMQSVDSEHPSQSSRLTTLPSQAESNGTQQSAGASGPFNGIGKEGQQ